MKKISLSGEKGRGKFTLVDDDIFEKYGKLKWHLSSTGYVVRRTNHKTIRLHRLVANCPENLVVDHLNRDKLDNRRENLRCVTQAVNMQNREDVENAKGYYYSNSKCRHDRHWVVEFKGISNTFLTEGEAKKAVEQIKVGTFVKRKDILHEVCRKCGSKKQVYGGVWGCRNCVLQNQKRYYQRKKRRIEA